MIEYKNIQRFYNIPFEEYLKMPGYSQSFLKHEINGVAPGIEVTDNMRLGSLVDSFLTEPEKVDYSSHLFKPAKSIAAKIQNKFGHLIQCFEKQVSFTADAVYNGWSMPVRGRIDFGLSGHAVIDLKVTKDTSPKNIQSLINFMGYDHQLYSYSKFYGVNKAYLIVYFVKANYTELYSLDVTGVSNFWASKIEKFGSYGHQL